MTYSADVFVRICCDNLLGYASVINKFNMTIAFDFNMLF